MGTREGDEPAGWEQNLEDLRALDRAQEARGWASGRDLVSAAILGAGHHETFWRARIADVPAFLFPPREA